MTQELRAADAAVSGVAGRISAAEKPAALQSGQAVLRATVHITRASTGMVETYDLIGTAVPDSEPDKEP